MSDDMAVAAVGAFVTAALAVLTTLIVRHVDRSAKDTAIMRRIELYERLPSEIDGRDQLAELLRADVADYLDHFRAPSQPPSRSRLLLALLMVLTYTPMALIFLPVQHDTGWEDVRPWLGWISLLISMYGWTLLYLQSRVFLQHRRSPKRSEPLEPLRYTNSSPAQLVRFASDPTRPPMILWGVLWGVSSLSATVTLGLAALSDEDVGPSWVGWLLPFLALLGGFHTTREWLVWRRNGRSAQNSAGENDQHG